MIWSALSLSTLNLNVIFCLRVSSWHSTIVPSRFAPPSVSTDKIFNRISLRPRRDFILLPPARFDRSLAGLDWPSVAAVAPASVWLLYKLNFVYEKTIQPFLPITCQLIFRLNHLSQSKTKKKIKDQSKLTNYH